MSGGVDSSVCAALLQEQGHEVIGVHMKLHDQSGGEGHCCGLDDAWDARRVADRLGIPFYVMDLQEAFREAVIDPYVGAWRAGLTPNPCVTCNGILKFRVLLRRATALGAEALATGHYARTHDGRLFAAVDEAKDQSYFLHPVPSPALRRTLFPLGELRKPEVRAHARALGLVTAEKAESMEVCFVPGDDHAAFVSREAADLEAAGDIVDESGQRLGAHAGYHRFTIGQRRGLGLAGGPWFVLAVNPESRQVTVGPESRLLDTAVHARGVNVLREPLPGSGPLTARLRHRGARVPCEVESLSPLRLRLLVPARAVTPGQSVVVYEGDEVLLGGTIVKTPAEATVAA